MWNLESDVELNRADACIFVALSTERSEIADLVRRADGGDERAEKRLVEMAEFAGVTRDYLVDWNSRRTSR